jgi:YD repeat-containing protein
MQRALFLLLAFCFISGIINAQECSVPDTALMRQNQVKRVSVYYHPNDTGRYLHHVYEYNRSGQLVKEREGYSQLWTRYAYDEAGRKTEISNFTDSGGVQMRTRIIYFGKELNAREIRYEQNDGYGLKLRMVYRYDSLNRMIYQAWYYNDTLRRAQYLFPNNTNGPVDSRDSLVPERKVTWTSNGRLVKWIRYDAQWKNPVTSIFILDEIYGYLKSEVRTDSTGKHIFVPEYDDNGNIISVTRDGEKISEKDRAKWERDHNSFPRPKTRESEDYWKQEDYGLPVPELVQKRQPVFNKKGLMTEEIIDLGYNIPDRVKFTFQYEYFTK